MKGFLAAVGFLTVVPVPPSARGARARAQAGPWFPVVGLALGAALLGAAALLSPILPPLVAGALLTTLWAALTGCLHLDGLADSCDGLLASTTRERRLEILRDPRVGAFGAVGLVLVVLLKAACLSAPAAQSASSLLVATALSRWLALALLLVPPARPDGMGQEAAASVRRPAVAAAAIVPLAVIVLGGLRAALAAAASLAAVAAIGAIARRRLGGVTGDVLGLSIEVAEVVVLVVHCVEVPP